MEKSPRETSPASALATLAMLLKTASKQRRSGSRGLSSLFSMAKSCLSQMIEKIEKGSYRTNHVIAQAKKSDLPKEGIVLSLCDGMGCAARALQDLDMIPAHYIGVEIDPVARKVAQNLNPPSSRFQGIDHSRFSDVMKITKSDIEKLGEGAIDKKFLRCSMRRLLISSSPPKPQWQEEF